MLHHLSIAEVSVIGRRHSDWGEEVIDFVVPWHSHSVSKNALDQFCLDRIAGFKRPKEYISVFELTKNNYGKVLKIALRSWIKDCVLKNIYYFKYLYSFFTKSFLAIGAETFLVRQKSGSALKSGQHYQTIRAAEPMEPERGCAKRFSGTRKAAYNDLPKPL